MEQDTFIDFGALVPEILTALGTIVTIAIGWAAAKFTQYTNIEIEANHREALHKAINTGITLAIEKVGTRVDVKNVLIAQVAEWVIKSVPDALKWFKLDGAHHPVTGEAIHVDPKLEALIESKIPLFTEPGGV